MTGSTLALHHDIYNISFLYFHGQVPNFSKHVHTVLFLTHMRRSSKHKKIPTTSGSNSQKLKGQIGAYRNLWQAEVHVEPSHTLNFSNGVCVAQKKLLNL